MSHEKHCSGTSCQLLLVRLFALFRTEAVFFLLFAQQSFYFYGELYAHVLLNQFVVYQWPARYPLSLQKFEKLVMLFFVLLSINIVLNIIVISKRNMIASVTVKQHYHHQHPVVCCCADHISVQPICLSGIARRAS